MKKIIILLLFIIGFWQAGYSQVELVPVGNPVYSFLKRMQVKKIIPGYNSAQIPVSREEVGNFLKVIKSSEKELSYMDKKMLEDYSIEFEFDMNKTLKNSSSLIGDKFEFRNFFENKKQKYIYSYADSNVSAFFDINGRITYRQSSGDSLRFNRITLGELGLRFRGTLFDAVGFYIRASNGLRLTGDKRGNEFVYETDPFFRANTKFYYENENFDSFEGYLRYRTPGNWLALTIGKEALNYGFGYVDKMWLSNNTVPFSFGKLDLKYKAFNYSFVYGSLKGDSLGKDISWKNIVTHRLDIQAAKFLRFGLFESVIFTSTPFSWVYLNPVSFLVSGDLNTGSAETYKNNTIGGIDFEINPVKNLAFQGTFVIDDLNLNTLGTEERKSNENKFAYQIGGLWTDAFTIPNVTFALEYTRINPFVYSHRSNKNTYTNWSLPLGHSLPPNSDEIAAKLSYDITNRIHMDFLYRYQRSGAGYEYDSLGKMIVNYGGDINRGDLDVEIQNKFLQGERVNRNIFTLNLIVEPIKQYFLELKMNYRISDLQYLSKTYKDFYFWLTARVDY